MFVDYYYVKKYSDCGSALVLLVPQVTKAEWVPVADSGGSGSISVRAESIIHKGNIASFWRRDNYPTPVGGAIERRTYMSIDCQSGLQQFHRIVGFGESGQRLFNEDVSDSTPATIRPGSMADRVYDFVCQ